jgi:hypothetical protein
MLTACRFMQDHTNVTANPPYVFSLGLQQASS